MVGFEAWQAQHNDEMPYAGSSLGESGTIFAAEMIGKRFHESVGFRAVRRWHGWYWPVKSLLIFFGFVQPSGVGFVDQAAIWRAWAGH
jgi:hypothetical protein